MPTDLLDQPPWAAMREKAANAARGITSHRQPFNLQLDWPKSYEQLLADDEVDITNEAELLERTLATGRVMLAAEAGSGKTWLLAKVVDLAASSGRALPVLIQLKNMASLDSLPQADSLEPTISRLLEIAVPDITPAFATSNEVPPIILLVDGLNEIPRSAAELVMASIDELARRYPFLSVLVTDRLVRRAIDLERWTLTTILPLSDSEVRRAWTHSAHTYPMPASLGILNRPFFLDTALDTDIAADSEAATIEIYYRQKVGLDSTTLAALADTAFDAYAAYEGRSMPETWLRQRTGRETFAKLIQSDAVRTSRGQAWFTHHLLHDFLAARALIGREADWDANSFDTVTLTAASFDSLRLAVEQLPGIVAADTLVRRIYDWNYYGAAYAMAAGHVSIETHAVILAMLADKKWDPVRATVTQVTDALRFDGSETARQFLQVDSRNELSEIVATFESEESWFNKWVALFTTPDGATANRSMVDGLLAEDSIESWTLANVLRRCNLDRSGISRLRAISANGSPVVRWRAVHVLGAHPSEQSIRAVHRRLKDGNKWVRYGAVRAMVEIAARASRSSVRDEALSILLELVQRGLLDDSMLRELSRALDVVPPPDEWPSTVAPLIQQLLGRATTTVQQEMWGRVMTSIVSRTGS